MYPLLILLFASSICTLMSLKVLIISETGLFKIYDLSSNNWDIFILLPLDNLKTTLSTLSILDKTSSVIIEMSGTSIDAKLPLFVCIFALAI